MPGWHFKLQADCTASNFGSEKSFQSKQKTDFKGAAYCRPGKGSERPAGGPWAQCGQDSAKAWKWQGATVPWSLLCLLGDQWSRS